MSELVIELFSEEIPARMQDRAAENLKALVTVELERAGLGFAEAHSYATPRRLALVIDGLPSRQADRQVERRGPKADAPQAARDGFLASLGRATYRLEEREEKKGRALYALIEEPGRGTAEVLSATLPDVLARFTWSKSMRWGSGDTRWVRPLHSIVCLFDGVVVPFRFGPVESGDVTAGHRFMAPGTIRVRDFADYRAKLEAAKVVLDGADRRRLIADEAARLAEREGLRVKPDEGLFDELKGLVEWPVPLMGRIDEDSMRLPPEVLTTSMRTHQRYLALLDADGNLAPRFITVANIQAADGGAAIIAGNERVLRARLWDARFFWDQDRKRPLESFLPGLDGMVFHAKLGSVGERVNRLVALAGTLVSHVPGADRTIAQRAALLAKADLRSGMVGEFPELQGVIGGYYADGQQERPAVGRAIADQYLPKGLDDDTPILPNSIVIALADKLDMLAGFYAADVRASGSKDPFGLRRAEHGVSSIIVTNLLRMPLRDVIMAALAGYGDRFTEQEREQASNNLFISFFSRSGLRHVMELVLTENFRYRAVSIVLSVQAVAEDDLVREQKRLSSLVDFLKTDDGTNLVTAYRRASNIVRIEERKGGHQYEGEPDPALLREPAEVALHNALLSARGRIAAALASEDYTAAMAELAALRAPVDAFFDRVKVNADEPDLRVNRLLTLGLIRSALGRVADFGLIEDAGGAR